MFHVKQFPTIRPGAQNYADSRSGPKINEMFFQGVIFRAEDPKIKQQPVTAAENQLKIDFELP